MGNRMVRNSDKSPINSARSASNWAVSFGICCSAATFIFVASVIVLSLIPVYLPRKGDDISLVTIADGVRAINIVFATNSALIGSRLIINFASIAQQINRYLGYPSGTLGVRSVNFNGGQAANFGSGKKKRQTTALSCESGDRLGLQVFVYMCPTSTCKTLHCFEKCIADIQRDIKAKFSSSPVSLSIPTADGTPLLILIQFCSFGEITSGTSTVQPTIVIPQQILTQCQPNTTVVIVKRSVASETTNRQRKVKMHQAPNKVGHRTLLENAYLVEFAPGADEVNHFKTVTDSLHASHQIHHSTVHKRHHIHSPLFSGVSFSVTVDHPIEAIEMIKDAVAIYPIYHVPAPKPFKRLFSSSKTIDSISSLDILNSFNLTNISQVHEQLGNFGDGVMVAVIDSGIYYKHPALGGCFGAGCKVAFGYDLVGDAYSKSNMTIEPDDDPLDDCSSESHGTHVAGIIAANATAIDQPDFMPFKPFLAVAPKVTLGAYRIFGCPADNTQTDVITEAIFRAYNDNADIITMSVGGPNDYTESSDAIAAQRVSDAGVYVTFSFGNDGDGGLQTNGDPAVSSGAIAVASVDNLQTVEFYIIAPNDYRIHYLPGAAFGGWTSIVNSTIAINNPNMTISDGCAGPNVSVAGVVVLFAYNLNDACGSATRCDLAAQNGAIGCLLYNVSSITGSSSIPSGSISLADGLSIVSTVTANPSAVYTFTDLLDFVSVTTGGTPSYFTSFGLTGDLLFKPQISSIGGYVYSTISLYAAQTQHLSEAYAVYSGTSMATPYLAGILALFLANIGNPAPNTASGFSENGVCRPNFSIAMNVLQSTARPVNIYDTTLLATTAQQGAGLVDAFHVLSTSAIFFPSELALNDTVRQATSYKVNLYNIGTTLATYQISHGGAALATGATLNDDQLLNTPLYSPDYANVSINPTELQLYPGQSREITLQFEAPQNANPTLLPIYSGFIYATNNATGETVHMSYAGVVGNYGNAQIFVRNSSSGITTGVLDANYSYISDAQMSTLNATDGILIIVVTAWPTRLGFADIVSPNADTFSGLNSSYNVVYSYDTNNQIYGLLYAADLPRNVLSSQTQGHLQAYSFIWNGRGSLQDLKDVSQTVNTTTLNPGQYIIRFIALQHFGNQMDSNAFEIYRTPPFNLVY